jgi:membrane protease YdiL (CAAX protease family)
MAYPASKQFSYIAQLSILVAFIGAGILIGMFASLIPLLGKINLTAVMQGSSKDIMSDILKPENATALRWTQFISTLFMIFLPTVFYAWLCHKKAFTHLGYEHKPDVKEIGLVLVIMFAAMPLVAVLSDLTEMLPLSKATLQHFKQAEDEYNKEVSVIARMNNVWDYISSMVVIAFLPALFEETLFRGALQNLLSRWTKMPILSIVISAAIFSAVHGSYLGFLSRFVLGFILGWFYYRTGNIWLNITGHFFNNALAVTALYITTKPNVPLDPLQTDTHFPLWIGLVSLAAVYGLLQLFDIVSKKDIDHPGEEVLITAYNDNPFLTDINNIGNSN